MKRLVILMLVVLRPLVGTGQTLRSLIDAGILSQGNKGITATKLRDVMVTVADSVSGKVNKSGGVMSGAITAPSFVRTGGTSSQFLKANGSVDGNTYFNLSASNDAIGINSFSGASSFSGVRKLTNPQSSYGIGKVLTSLADGSEVWTTVKRTNGLSYLNGVLSWQENTGSDSTSWAANFNSRFLQISTAASTYAPINSPIFTGNTEFVGNVNIDDTYKLNVAGDIEYNNFPAANTIILGNSIGKMTWGQLTNSYVASGANIDASKLGTGIVSTTELNYLDGVTSGIQAQINNKADKVSGKGFSANDYTTTEKTKLGALPDNSTLQTALDSKYETLLSVSQLQAYTKQNIARFDGSDWVKKSGNMTSNGGSYAGTIIRVDGSSYWERQYNTDVNSKWFGAESGSTRDIGSIVNSMQNNLAGGVIIIPAGVNILTTTIVMKRGFILRGEKTIDDANASTIKLADNQNKSILTVDAQSTGVNTHYMGLENLIFDGNYANQTTESEMVVFGGYIGTYMRYCFLKNAYGVALSGKYGLDMEIDHVWILNTVTSTYAFDTNNHLAENERDGLLNISHLFVENTRKEKTGDGYTTQSVRQNAIRFQKIVNLNVNHLHIEVAKNAISLSKNRDVNFTSISSAHIGNTSVADVAIVSILDGITDIIRIGNCITYNSSANIAMVRKVTGLTSNYIPDNLNAENMLNYIAQNDFDIGVNTLPYSNFANKIDIQKLGGTSEGKLSFLETSGGGTFMKQQGSAFKIGSNVSQVSDKDYITINSYGNNGDNIVFNVPLTLGNRSNAGFLGAGNVMLLNNVPAFTFGSNRAYPFVTTYSGNGVPLTTPDWVGQTYIDVTNSRMYFAKGTSSASDWSYNYKQSNIDDLYIEQSNISSQPTIRLQYSTKNSYIRQNGYQTKIGSSINQASDKDFLIVNSFGNSGDNISLNTALSLFNRSDAANLSLGNIMLLNNNPAFTFGSNRAYNFVTTFSGSGVPSTTPDWIGQTYVDVTNSRQYFAKGTSSSADWVVGGDVDIVSTQTITGTKTFRVGAASGITFNSGNTSTNNRFFMAGNGLEIQTNDGSGTASILSLHSQSTAKFVFKQTGDLLIGTTTSVPSSALTINANDKGFLPPRITATQASAISSPAEGLMVYVTDTNGTFTAKGWWGWNGSSWKQLDN